MIDRHALRRGGRAAAFAALLLAVPVTASAAQGLRGAGPCPVPRLGGEGTGTLDRDRAALTAYEACLTERMAVAEVLDPEALPRLDLQRDTAAALRRTLDAWGKALADADARVGS